MPDEKALNSCHVISLDLNEKSEIPSRKRKLKSLADTPIDQFAEEIKLELAFSMD